MKSEEIRYCLVKLLNILFEKQQEKLLILGREIVPQLTSEDLLQPMDFPELELNHLFRFEEGILMGIGEVRAAVLAYLKDIISLTEEGKC